MLNLTDLASVPSDWLRLAAAAYLARFTGISRNRTESDLRCYLAWYGERGLGLLAAQPPGYGLVGRRLLDRLQVMMLVSAGWQAELSRTPFAVCCPACRAREVGSGCSRVMIHEGLLDALGAGGSDALVDGERLLQVDGAVVIVAVLEVAAADSFQGTCFF